MAKLLFFFDYRTKLDNLLYMNSLSPSLSIGIPVYNGGKYLKECLDSLLNQTYSDFEIIISDNGSTDDTESICLEYQKKDNRVRYYRNDENIGITANYNKVFNLSKGKYFKWSSANDLCDSSMFLKCIDVLESHIDVALCYTNTNIINDKGQLIKEYDNNLHLMIDDPKERLKQFFFKLDMNNVMNGIFRRTILEKTSLLAPYLASDINMLVEVCLLGKYYEINEYLFSRRFDEDDINKAKNVNNLLKFYNTGSRGKIVLKFWRLNFEHYRTVLKSSLSFASRIDMSYFLLKKIVYDRNILVGELWTAAKGLFR